MQDEKGLRRYLTLLNPVLKNGYGWQISCHMHFNHNSGNQVITVIQVGNSENGDTKYSCRERRVKEEALCCGESAVGAQGGEPHPFPQALVLLYKLMLWALEKSDAHLFQSSGQLRSPGTPAVTPGFSSSQVAKVLTLSGPTRAGG